MASTLFKVGIAAVAVLAVLFQTFLGDNFWKTLAIGRVLQPIGDFPYKCRRIHDPRLQACEDMWLSESTRQLFLACSDPRGRKQWSPIVQKLNWEGRSRVDAVVVMDIDKPDGDSFVRRVLSTQGLGSFSVDGDEGRMYLLGMSGADNRDNAKTITLALVNYRPSVDPATGRLLDPNKAGSNATIEIFETGPEARELRHLRTFADPVISMPNRPALVGSDVETAGFYVTNDSKEKVGLKAQLSMVLPLGNLAFCDASGCEELADGFKFPNGLHRARDGLLYVPTTGGTDLHVYREVGGSSDGGDAAGAKEKKRRKKTLEEVAYLDLGYPLDNISEDAEGDLFVPGFPKPLEFLTATDPLTQWSRTTIFRIRRKSGGDGKDGGNVTLVVDKILEDGQREVLPGVTSVVHDAKTGRLFLAGINTPFISVCDPK